MTDAELIYNALLRAERRYEAAAARTRESETRAYRMFAKDIIQTIRQEIGKGLAQRENDPAHEQAMCRPAVQLPLKNPSDQTDKVES